MLLKRLKASDDLNHEKKSEIDSALEKTYYNPKLSPSFSNNKKLYEYVKKNSHNQEKIC